MRVRALTEGSVRDAQCTVNLGRPVVMYHSTASAETSPKAFLAHAGVACLVATPQSDQAERGQAATKEG